ncbi:CPBP family intramembrane glutamic endopeptidase [Pleomorphovibrio marinus]|uniref:CPBP family intramembrane glutamic endopeptidase n=1 Tax=Pleomorphovibrio marinus TaxID=2164132 RepID=UPI000E0C224A|nr:CPBP family intramembrane glutamic endopeptidase [Pleomorphovibrio marinus]
MSKKIFLLGIGTLLGFGGLGFVFVTFIQGVKFWGVLQEGVGIYFQVTIGVLVGGASAGLALGWITRPFFAKEYRFYRDLICQFNWSFFSIVFVSLCAGIGEELFFRAGLQPLLGLWLTSFLFVALHGYLNPYNWRISVYGVQMVLVIAVFGWLFEEFGIWSAITAHAIFDWIVISFLVYKPSI